MSSTSLNINDLLISINSSTIWAFFFFLKFRFSNYDIVSSLYNEGNVDEKELITFKMIFRYAQAYCATTYRL